MPEPIASATAVRMHYGIICQHMIRGVQRMPWHQRLRHYLRAPRSLHYAARHAEWSITLQNVLDALVFPRLPGLADFTVVMRFTAPAAAGPSHELELRAVDEDGQPLLPPYRLPLLMESVGEGYPFMGTAPVTVTQMRFERPGQFAFEIFVDGAHVGTVSWFVHGPEVLAAVAGAGRQ